MTDEVTQPTQVSDDTNDQTGRTFTQAELDEIIRDRLAKAEKSKARAIQDALREQEEAQRIASLEGEEKLKAQHAAQLAKIQKEREEESNALAAIRRELAMSRAEARLAGLNLPTGFAANMLGEDDEATNANIDVFHKAVNDLVAAKVAEGLHRGAPPAGGTDRSVIDAELDKAMGITRS